MMDITVSHVTPLRDSTLSRWFLLKDNRKEITVVWLGVLMSHRQTLPDHQQIPLPLNKAVHCNSEGIKTFRITK